MVLCTYSYLLRAPDRRDVFFSSER